MQSNDNLQRFTGKVSRAESEIETFAQRYGKVLDVYDWHFFFDWEPGEVRSCYFYEYLRGAIVPISSDHRFYSEKPRLFAELMAANGDFMQTGLSADEITRRMEVVAERNRMLNLPIRHSEVFAMVQPPWPNVSWQRLSSDERKRRQLGPPEVPSFDFGSSPARILQFANDMLPMPIADVTGTRPRYVGGVARHSIQPPGESTPFEKDPLMPVIGYFRPGLRQKDIVHAFKERLARFAKSCPKMFEPDDRGKGGYKTALQQLGALRLYCLKDYISAKERAFMKDNLHDLIWLWAERAGAVAPKDKWYRHPGQLASAAKRAFDQMAGMFVRERTTRAPAHLYTVHIECEDDILTRKKGSHD